MNVFNQITFHNFDLFLISWYFHWNHFPKTVSNVFNMDHRIRFANIWFRDSSARVLSDFIAWIAVDGANRFNILVSLLDESIFVFVFVLELVFDFNNLVSFSIWVIPTWSFCLFFIIIIPSWSLCLFLRVNILRF